MRRWGYSDNTQSVNCNWCELQTMTHLFCAGYLMTSSPSQSGQRYVRGSGNTLCEEHERRGEERRGEERRGEERRGEERRGEERIGDERRRRMANTKNMTSCMRDWTLRKVKIYCIDWRDRDTVGNDERRERIRILKYYYEGLMNEEHERG